MWERPVKLIPHPGVLGGIQCSCSTSQWTDPEPLLKVPYIREHVQKWGPDELEMHNLRHGLCGSICYSPEGSTAHPYQSPSSRVSCLHRATREVDTTPRSPWWDTMDVPLKSFQEGYAYIREHVQKWGPDELEMHNLRRSGS
jgi:hypothetical protein